MDISFPTRTANTYSPALAEAVADLECLFVAHFVKGTGVRYMYVVGGNI